MGLGEQTQKLLVIWAFFCIRGVCKMLVKTWTC